MQYTTNYNLKKPEGTDVVNIDDLNANADIIDTELAKRMINSGGVPSIQAGLDADKPTAGTAGRLYIATDTQLIYRDTGTAWQKVGAVKWGDIEGKPASFTPSAHKSTHASGGSDALTPADIGAVNILSASKIINVPADYPTIQAALDSLKNVWIPDGVTVTIQVAAGTYVNTSSIIITHPCGNRIQIVGATPITTTITGVGTISGSAGNWSVPITVANATGIQVDQYVIIKNTNGTGSYKAFEGIWKITAVNGNVITVLNTHRASTFPTATLTDGNFIVLTTILQFNNCHGIVDYNRHLGLLSNVALVDNSGTTYDGIRMGDYYGSALYGGSIVIGTNVGISGFNRGIAVYSCSISAIGVVVSNSNSHAISAVNNATIIAPSSIVSGNGGYGFSSGYSGYIAADSSLAIGNSNSDYYAIFNGFIFCYNYQNTNSTFSPALGTVGNKNAFISA